jgi:hypothetical protein
MNFSNPITINDIFDDVPLGPPHSPNGQQQQQQNNMAIGPLPNGQQQQQQNIRPANRRWQWGE